MRYNSLSGRKIVAIIRRFCEDITAASTAAIVGTSRNTINACFQEFRQLIFHKTLKESGLETGGFELDVPFIRTAERRRTDIIECFIVRTNSLVENRMSMELNLFGRSSKDGSQNLTAAKTNIL